MDQDHLRGLLEQVRAGAVDVDAAMERMRHLPFEDLSFAQIDHHRALRHGIPRFTATLQALVLKVPASHGSGASWPRAAMLIAAATVSTTLADFLTGEWAEDSIVDPLATYITAIGKESPRYSSRAGAVGRREGTLPRRTGVRGA